MQDVERLERVKRRGRRFHRAGNLANYDPKEPPPSPGAAALRQLAKLDPNVAHLFEAVESVERAAVKTGMAPSWAGVTALPNLQLVVTWMILMRSSKRAAR